LIDHVDATPVLQNVEGGFAADLYNAAETASIYFDDMSIERLGATSVPALGSWATATLAGAIIALATLLHRTKPAEL
jgi:hypothetical protein